MRDALICWFKDTNVFLFVSHLSSLLFLLFWLRLFPNVVGCYIVNAHKEIIWNYIYSISPGIYDLEQNANSFDILPWSQCRVLRAVSFTFQYQILKYYNNYRKW